ncbi:MAG: hypothetical protein QW149_04050 [Nitrososphaerota archaeon]
MKISGIIEVDEEEKGYAAGKIFVAAYSFGATAIGVIKNKIINKGGIYYTKEILKAWVTAPLIDALTIFYKYKQIKSLKDNKIEFSENNKISNLAKKLDEIASKDKGISEIVNNVENYAMDVSTWSKHCEPFKKFLEENVKISEDVSANEYINKIKILKICSEIFWECLIIAEKAYNGEPNNKAYGKLTKEKINKILNAIGEEIKENGINEENKYEIFKKGLSRLGIEELKLSSDGTLIRIGKGKFENMIEKSLGNVDFQKGDYLVLRIFTENKEPHFVIAEIGEEEAGVYRFGSVEFHKRIGTDKFYAKVESIIKNPRDWYNNLIKGKFDEININDDYILKILSENEIKIINKKLNLEKAFKLKNVKLYFIDVVKWGEENRGRFLAIKGEVKTEFNKIKIGMATDGDGNIILETYTGTKEESGRRIEGIDLNEERLRIKHKYGTVTLYFVDPLIFVKEIIGTENGKWLINIEGAEAWHALESNTVKKGAIGEMCGFKISEIKGYEPEGETAKGGRWAPSDVKIKLNGIISPEEVKTCDLTGKSIEERNKIFKSALNGALKEIDQAFKKDDFKDSKAGIVIIIGFDENRIDPNSKYVEIDVLIAKYDKATRKITEYISIPDWYNPNQ